LRKTRPPLDGTQNLVCRLLKSFGWLPIILIYA
jgi:hypothetical protein